MRKAFATREIRPGQMPFACLSQKTLPVEDWRRVVEELKSVSPRSFTALKPEQLDVLGM